MMSGQFGKGTGLGRAMAALALILTASFSAQASAQDAPTAELDSGVVAGERSGDLSIYRGIPFAAPPVGALRWAPPRPVAPWDGVRDATEFAPGCMQPKRPSAAELEQPISEDCLYLNVWSPAQSTDEQLPVLVWIHGGAWRFGSTQLPRFDGAALARRGVIFVSVAYRMGAFGYLAHPSLSNDSPTRVSGNYGLLDNIAALEWVHRNIGAFGGDPAKVTIMGQSAGAFSTSQLAQSPLAAGLFRGVIADSGASFGELGTQVVPVEIAAQGGTIWAQRMGATTSQDLRALGADEILAADRLEGEQDFRPNADGYVLPRDPVAHYLAGEQNIAAVLMGSNQMEGIPLLGRQTLDGYRQYVNATFCEEAPTIFGLYPATSDAEALAAHRELMRDMAFGWQAWTWARLQAQTGEQPIYYYHFNYTRPAQPNRPAGPIHSSELGYAMDNLDAAGTGWEARDREVADAMATYWTNFVKTGDPNGEGLPAWPAYTAESPVQLHIEDEGFIPGPVANLDNLMALDPVFERHRAGLLCLD